MSVLKTFLFDLGCYVFLLSLLSFAVSLFFSFFSFFPSFAKNQGKIGGEEGHRACVLSRQVLNWLLLLRSIDPLLGHRGK